MWQILYVSEATTPFKSDELEVLLNECIEGNSKHDITGALFYIHNRFIQCIEGPEHNVKKLLLNISNDARNKHVTVLRNQPIQKQSFTDWRMGFMDFDNGTSTISPSYLRFSDLADLRFMEGIDKEVFSLMSAIYKSS